MFGAINSLAGLFVRKELGYKLRQIVKNRRTSDPSSIQSYFEGSCFVISIVKKLYQKVEKAGGKPLEDLKKTIDKTLISELMNDVKKYIPAENYPSDIPSLFKFYDKARSEFGNRTPIDYESFMRGVQPVVDLLLKAYEHPRTENYKNLISILVGSEVDRAMDYIKSLK